MPLVTQLRPGFSASFRKTADFADVSYPLPFPGSIQMLDGTAANKADLIFADQRALGASGTENLDLAGGLSSPAGDTLTFVKVKGIYVRAAAANGGNIVVGGAASNAFQGPFAATNDKLNIPAGGYVELVAPVAGWTVTPGTGDLLLIANDDGAAGATYDIVIIGTSA